MRYFLAVDIGASSGRHILGSIQKGKLHLEEIHRFANGMQKEEKSGGLYWDMEYLFTEILVGMKKCAEEGKIPESVGIDTWAVDFALLDKEGRLLGPVMAYRDGRTAGMDTEVYKKVPEKLLFERTGIQKQIFNTIYQLMAVKKAQPEILKQAAAFLMVPDYFHYLLTGQAGVEYTNATTTQLVNAKTKDWDWEIIDMLEYPRAIFKPIHMPGTNLGELCREIQEKVGFSCRVVLPATHDTGSAVLAVPGSEEESLYISSGTWSLLGTEVGQAMCTETCRKLNFTNEGGYAYRFRLLKNIMGLWMIQSVRHEWKDTYSFAEICALAEKNKKFPSRVDVNAEIFLAPESMVEAVKNFCQKTGQRIPDTAGEIAAVIYQSLAKSYGDVLKEAEELTGYSFDSLHIVGGGSNADYLNRLTAESTGKKVVAGPSEATAVGNLMAQMLAAGIYKDIAEARRSVRESFPQKIFYPEGGKAYE